MKKNHKIILILAAFVLVVFGVACLIVNYKNAKFSPAAVTTSTSEKTAPAKKTTGAKTAPEKTLSYGELVKKYEGYRFQFSLNCTQVTPSSFVIKKGQKFMIDNRDDKKHVFSFGGQKYSLGAYGYAVVSTQLTGEQSVLCDGIQKVTVNVQS